MISRLTRSICLLFGLAACGGGSDAGVSTLDTSAPSIAPHASDSSSALAACDLSNNDLAACPAARSMMLPAALPAARGNVLGDDNNAAMLGFALFFDSDIGTGVACVACHAPESAFTDARPVSVGKGPGTRNAPTIFNAARLSIFFWDGRADSLWSQPLQAIETPVEMGSTRLALVQTIATDPTLNTKYSAAFGPLPDTSTWPPKGKPGDTAFDSLPQDTQTAVNRIASNVGKAFEAYMRMDTAGPSALDSYIGGNPTALNPAAIRGLAAFIDHGCGSCHGGPMLTDENFHDVGFPQLVNYQDPGRAGAASAVAASPFNLNGAFADPGTAAAGAPPLTPSATPGQFRTPSLRNVARTAPYGHDGSLTTLGDVMNVHAAGTTAAEQADVISFLQSLNGSLPPRPWNNWPAAQ